mgnify:CR=1 FL=1
MLLEVRGLEVRYGGIRAVKGIDLEIAHGELVCLIGANGAGKSSTLKAICRLITSNARKLAYEGEDLRKARVHELPRKGLVMVPEGRGIFASLTVAENLAIAARPGTDGRELDLRRPGGERHNGGVVEVDGPRRARRHVGCVEARLGEDEHLRVFVDAEVTKHAAQVAGGTVELQRRLTGLQPLGKPGNDVSRR